MEVHHLKQGSISRQKERGRKPQVTLVNVRGKTGFKDGETEAREIHAKK